MTDLHKLVAEKFKSGNEIEVERITITRAEYEAALAQPDHGFDRTASHMAGEYVDTAQPGHLSLSDEAKRFALMQGGGGAGGRGWFDGLGSGAKQGD